MTIALKGTAKSLMAVAMLGGALSIVPGSVAWAGVFDGMTFSVQGGGGHGKGGREARQQYREARSAQPVQQAQPQPRPRSQLTDEERRQLHRDIDKANRELYRDRRP